MPTEKTEHRPTVAELEALADKVMSDTELDDLCEMLMASLGQPADAPTEHLRKAA